METSWFKEETRSFLRKNPTIIDHILPKDNKYKNCYKNLLIVMNFLTHTKYFHITRY